MAGGGIYLTSTQLSEVNEDVTTTTIEETTTTVPSDEGVGDEDEDDGADDDSLEDGERTCDNFLTRIDFAVAGFIGHGLCQAEWWFHDTLENYGYDPSHIMFYIIIFLVIALILDQFFMKTSGSYGGMIVLGLLIALVFIFLGAM